ncbi:hypothetical protein FA15DRAFT_709227 [Coprinopsis marcescibilis]|uniref:Uncharacterized protein n=1 Tax=Coprinopsis marcescibilis TaxID=230819 RepID=A0A5C3KTK9_COPMA|nr:hypothetical protein FA15DRAFT_709227 [Coprinopsis marcescibilis]
MTRFLFLDFFPRRPGAEGSCSDCRMLFDRMFTFKLRKKSASAACTVSLESVSVSTGPNATKDPALEVVPPPPTKTKSEKSGHALLKCSPPMPLFASSKYYIKHKALERVKNGGTSPTAETRKRTSSSAATVSAEQPRSPPPTIAITNTPKRRRDSDNTSESGTVPSSASPRVPRVGYSLAVKKGHYSLVW